MAKIDNLITKYKVAKRTANALNDIDTTSNGKYLEWLFKMKFEKRKDTKGVVKYYVSKTFPSSLHHEVKVVLLWMDKNNNNPKLKTEYKDINFFKDVQSLLSVVGPLCVPSKREIKEQVTKVFEDDKWLLIIPKSFEASKLYGMNTQWCTTQKTYYNQYNKDGFLFYLIDKVHDRKFGIPIKTNTNNTTLQKGGVEFYNNEDKPLMFNALINVYGKALDPIWDIMSKHFREITLLKNKRKTLESAVRNLHLISDSFKRNDVYENDQTNQLMTELMKILTEDMK